MARSTDSRGALDRDGFYRELLTRISAAGGWSRTASPRSVAEAERVLESGSEKPLLVVDWLPRLAESELSQTLQALSEFGADFVIICSLHHSDKLRANGRNEHQSVLPAENWLALISPYFGKLTQLAAHDDTDLVVTNFDVPASVQDEARTMGRPSKISNQVRRFRNDAILAARQLAGRLIGGKKLFESLEGKSIAVVGNARSLALSDYGPSIDAHDIVIRCNRGPIIAVGSHGKRTNWLATSVQIEPAHLERLGASHIIWMSPRRRKMTAEMLRWPNLYLHPIPDILSLSKRAGVERPTTGLVLIDLLSRCPAARIDLYGFDFYRSQSTSGHQTVSTSPHDFDRERDFVDGLLAADPRFLLHQPGDLR